MTIDEQEGHVSRRDLAGLLGALGGAAGLLALTRCEANPEGLPEPVATSLGAYSSANIAWFQSIVNTPWNNPFADAGSATNYVLHYATGAFDYQIAVVTNYYSYSTGGPAVLDGGGGLFYWDGQSTAAPDNGTVFQPQGADGGLVSVGRWIRIWSGTLNVRWFGAKGDGTTDDTTAIKAAINAKDNTVGGCTLYFPHGNYLCTSTIDFGVAACIVRGDGWASNNPQLNEQDAGAGKTINQGSFLYSNLTSGYAFTIDNNIATSQTTPLLGIQIRDLAFVSAPGGFPPANSTTGLAIVSPTSTSESPINIIIDNVWIVGFSVGFNPGTSQQSTFRDLLLQYNNTGVLINGAIGSQIEGSQNNYFYGLRANDNQIGVDMQVGAVFSFFGGLLQGNTHIGVRIKPTFATWMEPDGGASTAQVAQVAFHGFWFEGNPTNDPTTGVGDIVFDASSEGAGNQAVGIACVSFHNCRSSGGGTIPFLRNGNPNMQAPSTYAQVGFRDCSMVGVTLALPFWSHGCVVIGNSFTQVTDAHDPNYSSVGNTILATSNFPTANGGLATPQLGGTTTTTAPSAGLADALPAKPKGYLTLSVNGSSQQIAYY